MMLLSANTTANACSSYPNTSLLCQHQHHSHSPPQPVVPATQHWPDPASMLKMATDLQLVTMQSGMVEIRHLKIVEGIL